MSSKERKPFGNVDANRIHHRHSKQSHHHRRRPQSKSAGGNDSSSIASLVDDSDYDFLSNPKPSRKPIVTGGASLHLGTARITERKGAWNSSSKTPKISNVTAISLQACIEGVHQDVDTDVPIAQFLTAPVPELDKTTASESKIAQTVPSAIGHHIRNGTENTVGIVELPAKAQGQRFDDIRRIIKSEKVSHSRSALHSNSKSTMGNFSSRFHGGLLETIAEEISEEEKESPTLVNREEIKPIEVEDRIADTYDVAGSKQQYADAVHDHIDRCNQNEIFENNSDMDESSDDELMGLTLSPSVPNEPSRNQNVEEKSRSPREERLSDDLSPPKTNAQENLFDAPIGRHLRTSDELSSPPKTNTQENFFDAPIQGDTLCSQNEYFHTPTQPFDLSASGIANESTPHPVTNILPNTKPPKYVPPASNKKEISVNVEPTRTLTQPLPQNRHITVKFQNGTDLAQKLKPPRGVKVDRKASTKKSPCISSMTENADALLQTQASRIQIQKDEDHTIDDLQIGEKNAYNTTKPPSKPTLMNENNVPLNKEVCRAVMGIPVAAENSLLGLIIETPHMKSDNDVGETESIDGSELTHDTYFLLDNFTAQNKLKVNYGNKDCQPEVPLTNLTSNSNIVRSPVKFKDDVKLFISPAFQTNTILNAKDEHYDDDVTVIEKRLISAKMEGCDSKTPTALVAPHDKLSCLNVLVDNVEKVDLKNTKRTSDRSTEATMVLNTPRHLTEFKGTKSNSPDSHMKKPISDRPGKRVLTSPSAQEPFLQILQEDIHTGILSRTRHYLPNAMKPILWTSEFAGRKFKAFGVNAAPVFRLLDGTYYQHPPLPPGWTVVVSRSQNMPFYIHPDFGATFYSPVPLPSNDGTMAGTTLLYQADTPHCPQSVKNFAKSPTPATPNIYGAQKSRRWSDETSTVVTQHLKLKRIDTPIGALAVASNTYFSESQNNAVSNVELQKQIIGITSASSMSGCLVGPKASDAHNSTGCSSSHSADSSTTVTATSYQGHIGTIPLEIQIVRAVDDVTDDDRFKRDLANTASNTQPHLAIESQSGANSNIVIGSADKSLEWAAELSPGSGETEMIGKSYSALLNDVLIHQSYDHNHNGATSSPLAIMTCGPTCDPASSSTAEANGFHDAQKAPISMIDDDPSPFESADDDHLFDCIPQKISLQPLADDDDMSLLQCSPQQSEIANVHSRRYEIQSKGLLLNTEESNLIVGNGDDESVTEECSYASGSQLSGHSSKSRVSCRSLNPKLPLCSLQYLHVISANKRTKKRRRKSVKRQRTTL